MKKIKFLMLTGLFYLLLLPSCDSKKIPEENQVSFDSIKIAETYHLFNDSTKPNCNLSINFTFPIQYKDPEVLKAIQNIFVKGYFGDIYDQKTPQEAVKFYKEEYLNNYKNLENNYEEELQFRGLEEDDNPAYFSYYENSSNSIVFNKANILTFTVDYNDYTGGAHGSHILSAFVIDLESGVLLTEEDIFYENSIDKISQLLLFKIMKENEVDSIKDLEYLGYDINAIIPNNNFVADEKGLTYYFNQYEIAPYVLGTIKVFLPYEEIGLYMQKEGPLALLAGV
jgi:Protein of unknown function (DUF3298).